MLTNATLKLGNSYVVYIDNETCPCHMPLCLLVSVQRGQVEARQNVVNYSYFVQHAYT